MLNGDVRIVEVVSPPDANGVYKSFVEIKQPDGKSARKKIEVKRILCFLQIGAGKKSLMKLIQPGKSSSKFRHKKMVRSK